MEALDPFARTFLPAAAEAGVSTATVGRHLPIMRRCVGLRDATIFVARCSPPDHPVRGSGYLLLLTRRKLVVTAESRVLRRTRLHLNSDLRHLTNVTWTVEPTLGGVQVSATAIDGVREHFWLPMAGAARLRRLDGLLRELFQPAPAPAWTTTDKKAGRQAPRPGRTARAVHTSDIALISG